jgi:hypothetical protein
VELVEHGGILQAGLTGHGFAKISGLFSADNPI